MNINGIEIMVIGHHSHPAATLIRMTQEIKLLWFSLLLD